MSGTIKNQKQKDINYGKSRRKAQHKKIENRPQFGCQPVGHLTNVNINLASMVQHHAVAIRLITQNRCAQNRR